MRYKRVIPWTPTIDVVAIIDWLVATFGPSAGQWKIDFTVDPKTGANTALIFEFRQQDMLAFFTLRWV